MAIAWIPESTLALESAIGAGILVEGHQVDFKRQLTAGAAGNKATAKDLAAFAVDGGQIVVGVDENAPGPPTILPIELAGLKERVDQIARSSVAPPLAVRCVELPLAEDPTRGCLVIVVPASPLAPHQADGRFWGRGDTTNRVLAPSEVEALYAGRSRSRADISAVLRAEVDRDPTPDELRDLGHLFVVAQPEFGDEELLLWALPGDGDFVSWVHKILYPTLVTSRWAPDIHGASTWSRRARGWAIHDYCISEGRRIRPNGDHPARENHLFDMEVQEDGGVRLFCARATDIVGGSRRFMDLVVCGLIVRVVETAKCVADTASFWGRWQFGVALTNVRDSVSYEASLNAMGKSTAFSEDTYLRTGTATYEELSADALAVGARLVAPLLRGFQSPLDILSLRRPLG
jgi:hypothetical protein